MIVPSSGRRFVHTPLWRRLAPIALAVLSLSGCQAKVRVLNVSPDYGSLDLHANQEGDSDSDTLRIAGVPHNSVSDYAVLESDTYDIKLKKGDVDSTLYTLSSQTLTEDSHYTVVAYGSTGRFEGLMLSEDVSEPDSGQAKVQIFNLAEAGSLDVYLTESSVSLEDASPLASIDAGSESAEPENIDSGDYRLRVTGADDTDDLRLDVPIINFGSKDVVSLILTATEGGVLVNAVVLEQQGSLSTYSTTLARVRGAVGVGSGTAITAAVGGVTVLSAAGVGVIGNYEQVAVGSAPVSLSVDGNAVAVADQTLESGGEYTLLVWSDASGTRTTLIHDDNRLPESSDEAKVRLLNGLSSLNVPVTLAIGYSPVAEGIAVGQASSFTELDSGSDYQFDISNTQTAEELFSQGSIELQSSGVYTMFMTLSGGTVEGALRKDR